MDRARWRDRAAMSALLLTAMISTAVTPTALSAGVRPQDPVAVDCLSVTPAAAARAALLSPNARAATVGVQAQLDRRGELTGRVIKAFSRAGSPLSVVLPAESFVGPAVGDLVVYTRHKAGASEVRALNLANGCDTRLAAPTEIVRSAVIDPTAASIYVHSVTRDARADAGVVRYDLVTGRPARILPPLRPPAGFGPIFATSLKWSLTGDNLGVQSCGFSRCLTRVADVTTGAIATFDRPGQGAFIGLTTGQLLTFSDCPGQPCAVLSTDVASGAVSVITEEAYSAEIQSDGQARTVLTIETSVGLEEVIL